MSKHLVFVYGTLRRGGVRAMPDLFPGSKLVGDAKLSGRLYDLGAYPGLMLDEAAPPVFGELYEVDDDTLRKLDDIEAPAHYVRKRVEVSSGDQRTACWVYEPDFSLYPERTLIASGDWTEYARTKTVWPDEP
jgi:gamma-glutamylcyclotransferase (GGCT)/AIG2-like uncharacterized protein YtfP